MNPIVIEELLGAFGGLSRSAGAASGSMAENSIAAQELTKAYKEAKQQLSALGDAIAELRGGAVKYGSVIDHNFGGIAIASSALAQGFKNMGLASLAATGILNDYAKASLKQHDLLVEGNRVLSEFGSLDPTGLHGILDTARSFGAVPETMQFVLRTVQKSSEDFARISGTTFDGMRSFSKSVEQLIDPQKDYERRLTNLGYKTEDLTKFSGAYLTANSKTLKGMTADSAKLAQESYNYMTILTELAELTGVSRDKQAQAAEQLQLDIQYRQHLRDLATKNGKDGEDQVKMLNNLIPALTAAMPQDMGNAFRDILINNGATTAMSAQLQGVVGPAVNILKNGMKSGEDQATIMKKVMDALTVSSGKYIDVMGQTTKIAPDVSKQMLGISSGMYDFAMRNMDPEAAKRIKENTERIAQVGDARLNEETRRMETERAYANLYQEMYNYIGGFTLPAVRSYTQFLITGGKIIKAALPGFKEYGEKQFEGLDKSSKEFDKIQERARQQYDYQRLLQRTRENNDPRFAEAQKLTIPEIKQILDGPNRVINHYGKEVLETVLKQKQLEEQNRKASTPQDKVVEKMSTDGVKLNIKEGAVQPGTELSKEVNRLATEITKMYPNIRVTGYNEPGVHSARGMHYKGQAVDMALEQGHKYTKEELEQIRKIAESQGFRMRDETNKPGAAHIHLELNEKTDSQGNPIKPSDRRSEVKDIIENHLASLQNQPDKTKIEQQKPVVIDTSVIESKLTDLGNLFEKFNHKQDDILTALKVATA